MTLRRLASLSALTAFLGFMMVGTTSCVVRSRGSSAHPSRHAHHHCHKKVCHAHGHGPGHH